MKELIQTSFEQFYATSNHQKVTALNCCVLSHYPYKALKDPSIFKLERLEKYKETLQKLKRIADRGKLLFFGRWLFSSRHRHESVEPVSVPSWCSFVPFDALSQRITGSIDSIHPLWSFHKRGQYSHSAKHVVSVCITRTPCFGSLRRIVFLTLSFLSFRTMLFAVQRNAHHRAFLEVVSYCSTTFEEPSSVY